MKSTMKTALASVLVLGALGTTAVAQAQQGDTLTVGMSGSYFPFGFTQNGELQGFEVDLMNAIGEEADLNIEYQTMSFSGLVGALGAGRIDTIANQITITPEREETFVFSQPYVFDGAQVVTREGNDEVTGVDSLKGKTVAVNLGSNFEQLLRDLPFAEEIDIRTYESNIEQDTALGRVDAFVMDRVSSAQLIEESPLPLQQAGAPFSEIRNAYPFRDDEAGRAMRDRVDAALNALAEDGSLAEISQNWFGDDITQPAE